MQSITQNPLSREWNIQNEKNETAYTTYLQDLQPEQVSSAPLRPVAQFQHDGMSTFCNKQPYLWNGGDEPLADPEKITVTASSWLRMTVPQWASVKLLWYVLRSLSASFVTVCQPKCCCRGWRVLCLKLFSCSHVHCYCSKALCPEQILWL